MELVAHYSGHHGPLHPLRLEPEVGKLRDEVGSGHATEMREEHALGDPSLGKARGESVEGGLAEGGALDATESVVIGEEVEMGEGFEIRLGPSALEPEGVRLDAVEERGGQALGDLDVGGAQVVGEDR